MMLEKKRMQIRRWTAWLLMLCMMGNLFSQSALAEGGTGETVTVMFFEELEEEVAWQEVPAGTPYHKLNLPNEIWGSRQLASSSDADRISVKVESWESDSIYDDTEEAEAGTEFVFTPVLDERYDVSGVQLPEIVVVLTDGAETASPSDATPSNALRTEAAKKFADGVKSLDADKLMALAQAYVDVAKELAAYTNQEPELIEEAKWAELQKKFEEADTAFWAVYDTVNGQTETSLLKQYEALSEEEKESVAEEYQILDQLIQKVEALLAVMYGVNTLVTTYNVMVGNTKVTDSNKDDVLGDGAVAFTPAAGSEPATLTLTNATIEGKDGVRLKGAGRDTVGYGGIVASCPLKIVVKGENNVSSTAINITASDTYDTYFNSGICMLVSNASNLEIVGEEGSVLNVTGGDNSSASASGSGSLGNIYSAGIALNEGNLTISNVTVRATGGKGKAGSSGNTKSIGICSDNGSITIDHAKVTATSPNTDGALYGLYCMNTLKISNGSDVTATAGTPTAGTPWVYGIWIANNNTIVINGKGSMLKATHGGGNWAKTGPIYSGPATIDPADDYTFMSGNDESSAAAISTPTSLSNVKTPYLGIISKTIPTPAPTFAAGKNTYQMSSKTPVIASFQVSNHEAGTTYTLYSAATGSSPVTDPPLNGASDIVTFTLNYSAPPTADQNYWVSATKGGIESTLRTQIFVKKAASAECEALECRTNVEGKTLMKGTLTKNQFELILGFEYNEVLANLPVALKVSEGAKVVAGVNDLLTQETIGSETYWIGTYDFSGNKTVFFTVIAEDGTAQQKYTATAKIPSYKVTYDFDSTKTTKTIGTESIEHGRTFTAKFTPKSGYSIAANGVTVTCSGVTLTQGTDYHVQVNGFGEMTVPVNASAVNGDIAIKVEAKGTGNKITNFTVANQIGSTVIDQNNYTITVTMPVGTGLAAVSPTVTVSPGATVNPTSGVPMDFSNSETDPVTYMVTAEDGKTIQDYQVTVKIVKYQVAYDLTNIQADATRPAEIGLNQPLNLTLNAETGYTLPAATDGTNLEVEMGGTVLNSSQYTYQVGSDRTSATVAIAKVTGEVSIKLKALNGKKEIEAFTIAGQVGDTQLDQDAKTIKIEMPYRTDLTKLKPTVTVSTDTVVSPASSVEQDFTNSQTYTVTAENGDTQIYTVTVEIPTFTVAYPEAAHVTKQSGLESVELKQSFEARFKADRDYILRTVVTRGNTTLTETTDYTWVYDGIRDVYTLSMLEDSVTGDLRVAVNAYNTQAKLTNFEIMNQVHNTISTDGMLITIEMPHGTNLGALKPTFDLSDGATADPASGTEQDFSTSGTNPFTYTVTAQDGKTKETYQVKVTIPNFGIQYLNQEDHMKPESVKPLSAALMEAPVITLQADDGYSVPEVGDTTNLIVTMNGTVLVEGIGYTYEPVGDRSSAKLTVKDVTGDVTVHVNALSRDNDITGLWTNRSTGDAKEGVIAEAGGSNTVKLTLPHDFDKNMKELPIRLLASDKVTVTTDGQSLETEEITVNGEKKTYWVGTYDFSKGPITITVTSQDGDYPNPYLVTAEIPEYQVTYEASTNITKESGEERLQWLESLTATFKATENFEQQGVIVKVENATLTVDKDYTFTYDSETRISTLTIPEEQVTGAITITPRAYHQLAELTELHIEKEVKNTVSEDGQKITIEMPHGTALATLAPTFIISSEATVTRKSGVAADFTGSVDAPVIYTVTAEDGKTTKTYQVTALIPSYEVSYEVENVVTSSNCTASVALHEKLEVTLEAKEGYSVPKLSDTNVLTVTMDGETLTGGEDYEYTPSQDRTQATIVIAEATGPVHVTMTGLSQAKSITEFTVEHQVGETRLSEEEHTIEVDMPYATNLAELTPQVTISDIAVVNPADGAVEDFSNSAEEAVVYTVTAEDGSTQEYQITITIPEYGVGYDLSDLSADDQADTIALKQELEVELTASEGYSVPETMEIIVYAEKGEEDIILTEGINYHYTPDAKKDTALIRFTKDLPIGDMMITAAGESRKKQITEFTVDNQVGTTTIDETEKTILTVMPYGTDLNTMKPVVTATDSNATVSPESGQTVDFTNSRTTPVIYTVTSEDRTIQEYQVTVRYPEVKVAFDTLGGTQEAQQALIAGDKAKKPADPVKETDGTKYYAFDGWYADAGYAVAYDFGKLVAEDITIYAKWKIGYKVLTEAANGTVTTSERDDTRIFYPGETVTVKATENSGYRFKDWNASADVALLADPTKAETTFIVPEGTVSLIASFSRKSSGGGGGGGGGTTSGSTAGGVAGGAGNISVGEITTTPSATGGTIDSAIISAANGEQAAVQVKKDAAGNIVSRDAAVSMEQTQTSTSGQQTSITYNMDSNLVKQAVQTSGATPQSPLQITIPVSAEALAPQIQNPQVQEVTVNLVIPTAVTAASDIRIQEIRLEKGVVEAAKAAEKDITVSVKNEAGIEQVSWSFNGAELKNAQTAVSDINLALDLTPVPAIEAVRKDLKEAIQPISGDGLVITFHHSGQLPATAKIRMPSTVQRVDGVSTNIQAGDRVRLYYYNPQTKRLEAVGADTYVVDAQNYVTIALDHCSEYVLIPVRAENQTPAQETKPSQTAGTHTVQAGDNLWKIASRYGCSVGDLKAANPGIVETDLRIGQVINVPATSFAQ